jgi:hypothetical protein
MARPHVREFLARFVKPLVAGGELHVGAPIPLPDVDRWEQELHDASVEQVEVDDARHAVLSTLVCRPPAFLLEGDELALAAGLHNALFLVHPRADQWSVSEKQRRKIIDTALAMVSQPMTKNRTRVMARHALLHNVFHLTRNDITVSWWTGRARFHGQQPPARLTSWKTMRRVREEVTVVDFDELLAVPDTAPVIATLLRRTPMTQLLDAHPGAPPLHWEDAVFLLRDAELARAVAYRLVPDAPPREVVAGPSRLAAAFEQMLERAPDGAAAAGTRDVVRAARCDRAGRSAARHASGNRGDARARTALERPPRPGRGAVERCRDRGAECASAPALPPRVARSGRGRAASGSDAADDLRQEI